MHQRRTAPRHALATMAPLAICAICLFGSLPSEAASGGEPELVWENLGQAARNGNAFGVGMHGRVVVASGNVCSDPTTIHSCDWFVRAHDAHSGATIWEDHLDVSGLFDRSQDLVVDAGRVFASGWVLDLAGGIFEFVVRAYDVDGGALLWEQRIDRGGAFEFAEVVEAGGGRVFVAGRVNGVVGSDFALFAFDATTGALLWESVTDTSPTGGTDVIFALSKAGGRIYVSGGDFFNEFLIVRAHDAVTGAILWEDEIRGGFNTLAVQSLHAANGMVFATGDIETADGDFEAFVRAYDGVSGDLIWADRLVDPEGDLERWTTGRSVVSGGGDVVVGIEEIDPVSDRWLLRAYESRSGALRWERRLSFSNPFASIGSMAVDAGRILVGGTLIDLPIAFEWTLLALDSGTGELLWHDTPEPGGIHAIEVQGDRIFAAGFLGGLDDFDFVVRGYQNRQ